MSLFKTLKQHIHLPEIDPLGGGLAEEIAYERTEPEHIELDRFEADELLADKWDQAVRELHDDPNWNHFNDIED